MNTGTSGGDAIDLAGSGSFTDANASTITGQANGVSANNTGVGALSITTSGPVTASLGDGVAATAATTATGPITVIVSGAVTGGVHAIFASASTVPISITTSAAVTSPGSAIVANETGAFAVSVTANGPVSSTSGAAIQITNSGGANILVVGAAGSAEGASAGIVSATGMLTTITNAGLISNKSGLATDIAIVSQSGPTTVTNTGTITGVVNLGPPSTVPYLAAFLPTNTVNLDGGQITGTVNTGQGVLNWSGGAVVGAINMGALGVNSTVSAPSTATLSNLTSAELSGTTHLDAGQDGGLLTFSAVTYMGGSFAADTAALGLNLLNGWSTIDFSNGTSFTLTGDLSLRDAGVTIDATSTLHAGNDVNPTISSQYNDLVVTNAGTLDLTNGGFVGNVLTIEGTYTQTATGRLVIGVTPTAIDLVNVSGNANLNGTVTFAFAPGAYASGSRTFLSSVALDGTTFSSFSFTNAPKGFTENVAYTATNANLVLMATAAPTPAPIPTPTPVLVSPPDARIFSEQAFAFSEFNGTAVADLLNRTKPDGGGDTFYNADKADRPFARTWAKIEGGVLSTNGSGGQPGSHTEGGGLDAGFDVALDPKLRFGLALGYGADRLSDHEGTGSDQTLARASLYASELLGPFGFSEVVSYAYGWDKTDRATGLGDAVADLRSHELTGAFQISTPFELQGYKVTPDVGAQVSDLGTSDFKEAFVPAQAFAVSGSSGRMTLPQPYAELGVSREFVLGGAAVVIPDVQVGYRYDDGARGEAIALTAADGTIFSGNQVGLDRNVALFRLALTVNEGAWSGFLKYKADVSSGWSDQNAQIGVRCAF